MKSIKRFKLKFYRNILLIHKLNNKHNKINKFVCYAIKLKLTLTKYYKIPNKFNIYKIHSYIFHI